eukprot:1241242-Rhodomonas_salina.1
MLLPRRAGSSPIALRPPYAIPGTDLRVWRYQASRETSDSMRTPYGAVQYMRARHCRPGDHVTISVRDTHFLVEEGVSAVDQTISRSTLAGSRGSFGSNPAYLLRACYAMPGTDMLYGPTGKLPSYAMPGTDVRYGATRLDECERLCVGVQYRSDV